MGFVLDKDCPFCGHEVVKTSNKEIYGKIYGNGVCFLCRHCGASVGTHNNGKPLGVLANKEMKILKKACHDLFDNTWKSRQISRSGAYAVMSKKLSIEGKDCHFGHFGTDMLLRALEVLKDPNWFKG